MAGRREVIIMRFKNDWQICNLNQAEALKRQGWVAIAVSESHKHAAQMILGLRANELVNRLLSHLTPENQNLVKTEIAQMATEYSDMINLTKPKF